MNTINHTHAAIISITKYEAAVYQTDLDTARACLLETMGHIIAIARQTPGAPVDRPHDLGRPERTCRYHRILHDLSGILPIGSWTPDPRNGLALAWYECIELCQHHGWALPPQYIPERATIAMERPLLPRV